MSGGRKKYMIMGLAAAGCAVLLIAATFIYRGSHPSKETPPFLTLSGLQPGYIATSTLEMGKKASDLKEQDGRFALPDSLSQTLKPPYRISTSVEIAPGDYRDMVFTVGKDQSLTVLADGFNSDDAITLTLNDGIIYRNVPLDWSGRIELNAGAVKDDAVNACIQITGFANFVGLCHELTKGEKA